MIRKFLQARENMAFERQIRKMCNRRQGGPVTGRFAKRTLLQRIAYAIRTI